MCNYYSLLEKSSFGMEKSVPKYFRDGIRDKIISSQFARRKSFGTEFFALSGFWDEI
jgi:hypothetical protein